MTKLIVSAAVLIVLTFTGVGARHVQPAAEQAHPVVAPAEPAFTEDIVTSTASPTPSPEPAAPAVVQDNAPAVAAVHGATPAPSGESSTHVSEGVTTAPTTCSGRSHSKDTSDNGAWSSHRKNSTDGDCSND